MVGNVAHIISGTNFTAGWYEIISVVAGVSITVDRNCATAAGSNGVVNIGGAMSLNSSTTNQTDTNIAAAIVAGNTVWVKNGALTLAAAATITSGTPTNPVKIIGYNSTRGDLPTEAQRPSINCATFAFTQSAYCLTQNIIFTGTAAAVVVCGTAGANHFRRCKFINTSTTVNRVALNASGAAVTLNLCELISYRGRGASHAASLFAINSYFHDSDIGIITAGAVSLTAIRCLFDSMVTNGILINISDSQNVAIFDNTFFGGISNKTGTAIQMITSGGGGGIWGNIISGFVTGISHADANNPYYLDYNNFYNNTTDVSNVTNGANDTTLDPQFSSVGQHTGTAATTSGGVLTDGAANFANVTDNVDFCYIKSGTGVTAGQYLITSHTTTTLTLSPAPAGNATADKVYQVTTGRNFAVGANMKATNSAGTFPVGLSVGYLDKGAVQRQEPAASSGAYFYANT